MINEGNGYLRAKDFEVEVEIRSDFWFTPFYVEGEFEMTDIKIKGGSYCVDNYGTSIIYSGNIECDLGSAVFNNDPQDTLIIFDGVFSSTYGSAVRNYGYLVVNGGEFYTDKEYEAALSTQLCNSVSITGGTFLGAYALEVESCWDSYYGSEDVVLSGGTYTGTQGEALHFDYSGNIDHVVIADSCKSIPANFLEVDHFEIMPKDSIAIECYVDNVLSEIRKVIPGTYMNSLPAPEIAGRNFVAWCTADMVPVVFPILIDDTMYKFYALFDDFEYDVVFIDGTDTIRSSAVYGHPLSSAVGWNVADNYFWGWVDAKTNMLADSNTIVDRSYTLLRKDALVVYSFYQADDPLHRIGLVEAVDLANSSTDVFVIFLGCDINNCNATLELTGSNTTISSLRGERFTLKTNGFSGYLFDIQSNATLNMMNVDMRSESNTDKAIMVRQDAKLNLSYASILNFEKGVHIYGNTVIDSVEINTTGNCCEFNGDEEHKNVILEIDRSTFISSNANAILGDASWNALLCYGTIKIAGGNYTGADRALGLNCIYSFAKQIKYILTGGTFSTSTPSWYALYDHGWANTRPIIPLGYQASPMHIFDTESFTIVQSLDVSFYVEGVLDTVIQVPVRKLLGELPEAPALEGKSFAGWYDRQTGREFLPSTSIFGPKSIDAKYLSDTLTVTFVDGTTNTHYRVPINKPLQEVAGFNLHGSGFMGWRDSVWVIYSGNEVLTEDLTLHALYPIGDTVCDFAQLKNAIANKKSSIVLCDEIFVTEALTLDTSTTITVLNENCGLSRGAGYMGYFFRFDKSDIVFTCVGVRFNGKNITASEGIVDARGGYGDTLGGKFVAYIPTLNLVNCKVESFNVATGPDYPTLFQIVSCNANFIGTLFENNNAQVIYTTTELQYPDPYWLDEKISSILGQVVKFPV